jgi:hypothetical protein
MALLERSTLLFGVLCISSCILLMASVYRFSSHLDGLPLFKLPDNEEDPRHGGVSSESATCSRIGIDIVGRSGNAADAV